MLNKRRYFFGLLTFALLFTGFAQMPIFKRYYLADLPGFAWTADFYLNHRLHYILAFVLLFWLFSVATKTILLKRLKQITFWGWLKVFLWAGIVVTGIIRVLKNFPTIVFDPKLVMYVDWIHLGLPFLLFLVYVLGKIAGWTYFKQ